MWIKDKRLEKRDELSDSLSEKDERQSLNDSKQIAPGAYGIIDKEAINNLTEEPESKEAKRLKR